MTAAAVGQCSKLHLGLELGEGRWKLAFTAGMGQQPRIKNVLAGDFDALVKEIAKAKRRFGLGDETVVVSCYEAGRDGFWIHRELVALGIENCVIDSASIEVDRRARRAKSDGLDARKLVGMLVRYHLGEEKIWKVVAVPTVAQEDARRLHREQLVLQKEMTSHSNRIGSLLATLGLSAPVDAHFDATLAQLRQRDGSPVPAGMQRQLLHEWERWKLARRQRLDNASQQRRAAQADATEAGRDMRLLLQLRGIGIVGAWTVAHEFAYRDFDNAKQVGAYAGLTPTPYDSGQSRREQGISKAGNRRLRRLLIELAWLWVRHQPDSSITKWFQRRFGGAASRYRKIGIVAVARKLLVALWRLLKTGEIPEGAAMVPLAEKFSGRSRRRPALAAAAG